MSIKVYKTQTYRPYKIEVYGLQDNYIGTLQSYDDSFLGRVQGPKVSISGDGSQEFTCSVPRFYINPKTNEKLFNPRWEDVINGVLAENTRVLKVFVETDGEKKVYPFIVDKIVDKRDSHFSVFKEITGNGLAFAELGKVGLKLELNNRTVELEQEANKDKEITPTLQYWLDKVFPNEKDPETGKVIKWFTPWCYEIRMDWSNYADKENRLPNKVYADAYVNSWGIENNELVPNSIQTCQEKARMIDCSENGNKYNITQTLAETFGVFCNYEYKCAENGSFIKEYTDENGNVWQGRKVIFYNRAIKTDKPFMMEYQKNLQSISRTCETDEIYSKLYVTPIESSVMTDGYVTIANTKANPLLDEFILNFDYLYEKGAISDYQKEYIANYEAEIHASNIALLEISKEIEELTVEINNKKAEEAGYEKSISAAREQLVHYQTLRDNEVTNTPIIKDSSNSFSVVFITDGEVTYAKIRLEGVAPGTIVGYTDYKYEKKLFDGSKLVAVREQRSISAEDKNIYVIVDEDGYAIALYTAKSNLLQDIPVSEGLNAGFLVYLTLEYSPYNKYVDICKRFENIIDKEGLKKEEVNSAIKEKQTLLDFYTFLQNGHIKQKELLNQKLEKLLGPALREGYWTPDGYEEIGKRKEVELKIEEALKESEEQFFFDTELFEEEESGFYYVSKEALTEDKKTYFPYIDISDYINVWDDSSYGNLVLHLQNPSFKYVAQEHNALTAGNYFFIHEAIKYYFELQSSLKENDILEIKFSLEEPNPELILTQNETITVIPVSIEEPKDVVSSNVTNIFEGISQYLGDYKIYPNAGFIYAFIKKNGKVIPVLLLNNDEIHYSVYKQIAYSFTNNDDKGIFSDTIYASFEICYPRIAIMKENVNYESDLLSIKNNGSLLTKFEDYSILTRKGYPYFTIKINNNNSVKAVLNNFYSLVYYTSQANEILYQDAKEVAKENSRPRFSYNVQVSQIPSDIESFELGQLGYISDSELGVHAAQGYISQIVLQLDSPKDDEITIQNYKTKFEDLFSTITASSEAMKTNQHSYDIAASGFTSKGEIDGSILQDTFDNNKIELTYSNTNVHIDDLDGIVLTNTEPYTNGVYGQVILRGGGIFLSNTVDSNEERIWTTGITPNGINASTITTGQLDANLVRIFAGNNLAFQWNSEGLYAYKRDEETNNYLPNTYVRYSDKGLQYLDNGFVAVDLGWNGLEINSQEGALSLTGKDGLVLYEGSKNAHATNHVVKLGRFGTEEGNYSYGMRLYKKTEETDKDGCHIYTETLTTTNEGQLWLKDYIVVGANDLEEEGNDPNYGGGISGVIDGDYDIIAAGNAFSEDSDYLMASAGAGVAGELFKSVRFWAGTKFEDRENAPFRVLADGSVYATSLYIGTNSTIGGTSVKDILDNASMYVVKIESSNGFVYNTSMEQKTILTAQLYKNNLNLIGIPDDITLESLYYEVSENSGEWEPLLEGNNFPFYLSNITMDTSKKYRVCFSYSIEERQYTTYSEEIIFTAVSDGENGKDGIQGRGIEKTVEYYAANDSSINEPEEWSTEIPELNSTDKYLWNYEETHYTDGSKESTNPVVVGVYGNDGRGIVSIINYYLVTEENELTEEQFSLDLSWNPIEYGWSNQSQKTTITNRYLWNFEEIEYTSGDPQRTLPSIIGTHGAAGPQGEQGPAGDAGKDAKVYRLISSANSITRDLTILSPTQITIQIGVNEGGVNSVLNDISSFDLVVSCQQNNNVSMVPDGITVVKQENQWVIEISKEKYGYGSLVEAINLTLSLDGVNILTQSIPFILGSQLQDLAKIEEGAVYIDGGKIYANSVTANAIAAYTITADKIATNTITADKIAANFDLEIGAGRSINITTNGTFTVESDNFTITDEGNVSLTGEITAKSGSIGGWNISETSLHSGSDTNYVALSSDSTSNYRIWAGDTIAEEAPFSVEKDGTVTLTRIRALGEPDSNGNQSEKIISLYSQPLWAIWGNYSNRVTGFTAEQATDGTVTLTITRQSEEALTVNFKKATVTSTNYSIRFSSGEGTGFSANLIENSSSESTGISAYANLSIDINGAQSMARVIPQQASGPVAEVSLENVYNVGWAAAEEQVKWPNGSQETSFEISVPSTEVGEITTRTFTMTKGSNPNATEGYASVTYDNNLIARIPINDWYIAGVNSVGFNTSPISWENGEATITLTNGESKEIGAPSNCTITGPSSWTADHKGKVYVVHGSSGPLGDGDVDASSVFQAGYEAGKAAMGLKVEGNTVKVEEQTNPTTSITASVKDSHAVSTEDGITLTPGKVFTGEAGTYYHSSNIILIGDSWISWS